MPLRWSYISDHGDVSKTMTASSTPRPTLSYYQLHSALLIWESAWRDAHPQLFAQGRSNSREAVSSNSVFHTP